MPFIEKKERGKRCSNYCVSSPTLSPNKCTIIYIHLLRTGLVGSGEGFALRRTVKNVKVNVAIRKAHCMYPWRIANTLTFKYTTVIEAYRKFSSILRKD
jgi:hypothetical protein